MKTRMLLPCMWLAVAGFAGDALASKFVSVQPVDRQVLVVHFQDGTVHYKWDHTDGNPHGRTIEGIYRDQQP